MASALNNSNSGEVAPPPNRYFIHPAAIVTTPHRCLFSSSSPVVDLFKPNILPPLLPVFDLLVPLYHTLLPPPIRLSHSFFLRMDSALSNSLRKFVVDEGLVPSVDEELKRIDVLRKLKQIISTWIKRVAHQRRLPKDEIVASRATLLTYGSYGLEVHGPESDIDALCVAPYFTNMAEDFFIVLYNILKSRSEVSEIHCIKDAKVPLMRLKFDGIHIDLPFAQLNTLSVPDNLDVLNPDLLSSVDETSWKSLSAVQANYCILKLIPNMENFRTVLRCVKLWAKRRGVYGNLFGFLGGIHLAVMTAYVCQKHVNASVNSLMTIFFRTFATWPWPTPVRLHNHIQMPFPSCPFMPIVLPSHHFPLYCQSNIFQATFLKLKSQFDIASHITKDITRTNWNELFAPFPYSKSYTYFAKIYLSAPTLAELGDWVGLVKSRFPLLILKVIIISLSLNPISFRHIKTVPCVLQLEEGRWACDPNPTEYGQVAGEEPNVVFYWGLVNSGATNQREVAAVGVDFKKNIKAGAGAVLGTITLSKVGAEEVPKEESVNATGTRSGRRVLEAHENMTPVYSRHNGAYIVGYVPPPPPPGPLIP